MYFVIVVYLKVQFIKIIGVGIAIAVVLDATIIRMMLVPASLKLLGEYNWYCPAPLKKVIDSLGLQEIDEEIVDNDANSELQASNITEALVVSAPEAKV